MALAKSTTGLVFLRFQGACLIKGKEMKISSGSCCEKGQISLPGFNTKFTSIAFNNCFLHRFIVGNGTAKTWKQKGCLFKASQNWSMAVSAAAGARKH
jgi:hypothetical protein